MTEGHWGLGLSRKRKSGTWAKTHQKRVDLGKLIKGKNNSVGKQLEQLPGGNQSIWSLRKSLWMRKLEIKLEQQLEEGTRWHAKVFGLYCAGNRKSVIVTLLCKTGWPRARLGPVMTFPQSLRSGGRKGVEKDGGNENDDVILSGRDHTKGDSIRLDAWLDWGGRRLNPSNHVSKVISTNYGKKQ